MTREELVAEIKARGVKKTTGCYSALCYGGPFEVDELDEQDLVELAEHLGIQIEDER